jgi:AbrB family looped-hinge helix DNA binding protein
MFATLTAKGQVTLPKNFRTKLDLQAGDKIDFVMLDNGVLQAVPLKQSPKKLKGIVPKPAKPVTIDEMNQAIAGGAADL